MGTIMGVAEQSMSAEAFTFRVVIALAGAVGIVMPMVLLAISPPFLTPAGLYAAAALRLVLGTALCVSVPTSRAPKMIRTLRPTLPTSAPPALRRRRKIDVRDINSCRFLPLCAR